VKDLQPVVLPIHCCFVCY